MLQPLFLCRQNYYYTIPIDQQQYTHVITVLSIMAFFSLFFSRAMDFPGHFEQIFQQLNYQRVHGQLWDCVIVVGSRHFKAHRSVLAACSTHFRALFTVAEGDASMNMIQLDSEVSILKYLYNDTN